ncbi:MAG: 23S rRNA (uracil(1939)-C(5))-methyltransferase RlmD [Lachnospiraceae bacterium]|nr:23S rRNA (uracil(1939)-C(5))-methyltransferase RlmD [Lachnospiraceae bacterium]
MYKKNDILELNIVDTGVDGEGIAKIDGYVFFVKDAVCGDEIKAKVMKAGKSFGYAKLLEIIKPAKDRVEPFCPVANKCGGCSLLNLSYEAQLRFKEKKVKNNIERIGKVADFAFKPIVGMDDGKNLRYRNKTQFPVGQDKNGRVITGFFASRTHSVIEIDDCMASPLVNECILRVIRDFMEENSIKPYDEKTHSGSVRHVLIRNGFASGEINVCLVLKGDKFPQSDELVKRLKNAISSSADSIKWELTGLVLNINKEKTNVIMGKRCKTLWGKSYITDKIGDLSFNISPLSFYQVNPAQTIKMYEKALEYANLKGDEKVWDLYCGIGTISLFLAKKAGKVFGVEIVPEAIEDAKENAKQNGIDNVEFIAGAAEEVIPEYYKKTGEKPDVIVVDPPRKGCDSKLLDTIIKSGCKRLVYVSCDSATLARDINYLLKNDFKLEELTPFDNFPGSAHVECVCYMINTREK